MEMRMREQHGLMSDDSDPRSMQTDLEQTLMTAFCRSLDGSRLPPMTVMRMMAEALGSVYRQVAAAHRNQACPCGWQPSLQSDVESLRATVGAAAEARPMANLDRMQTLGQA